VDSRFLEFNGVDADKYGCNVVEWPMGRKMRCVSRSAILLIQMGRFGANFCYAVSVAVKV